MPVVLRHTDASAAVWRTFEIATTIALDGAKGPAKAWVPLPLARPAEYQRNLGHVIGGNATAARVGRDASSGAEFIAATWDNVASADNHGDHEGGDYGTRGATRSAGRGRASQPTSRDT